MAKIYGQLERAQIENVAVLPTAGIKGRMVFLTTTNRFYVDDGTNFNLVSDGGTDLPRSSVAAGTPNHVVINDGAGDLSSEAQLAISRGGTGQTTAVAAFDALAPTTTAGDIIVHNGSDNVRQGIGTDGQVLVVDSTLGNKLKWTTLQQGAKNYITYNNFENNALTGWNEASVTWTGGAPSGAPTVSATAAASIALSVTSTTPLAGTYSLQMLGTIAQGQGFCTDALTIDREDQAKVLQGSFYYEVTAGATNANFSGTSSNTLSVWIYDVTNSAWIQPAGVYNLVQSSGQGLCTFTFQTPATISQLRLFVFAANTASGSITMEFDDFALGPQKILSGPAVSDWESAAGNISVTNFGTVANTSYWKSRVGDSIRIRGYFQAGTVAAAAADISLTGITIDSAKLGTGTSKQALGRWWTARNGAAASEISSGDNEGHIFYDGSITNKVFFGRQATAGALLKNNGSTITDTSGYVGFDFLIPVSGWSSNTVMSSDTDTRVVAFSVKSVGTGTFTHTLSSTFQNLPAGFWGTPTVNTHGSFDSATNGGEYTVPVSGVYEIQFQAGWIFSSAGVRSARILIDGVAAQQSCDIVTSATTNTTAPLASYTTFLNAGQKIRCQAYQNSGGNLNYDISSSGVYNIFAVKKLSGPATIAANELVACRYTNCTGTFGTTDAVAVFATKDFDTHNFYNSSTGIASVPVAGKYRISVSYTTANGTPSSANTDVYLQVRINSIAKCTVAAFRYQVVASLSAFGTGSCVVDCKAGDTLDIASRRDAGAPSISMQNNNFTWLNIERIGY